MTAAGHAVAAALDGYYRDLDAGTMVRAAGWFTPDATYATPPPHDETGARVVARGRQALVERFEQRGIQPYAHELQLCLADGPVCIVEGVGRTTGTGEPFSTFVAVAQLGTDGRIDDYLACGCGCVWPDDAQSSAGRDDDRAEATIRRFLAATTPAARSATLSPDALLSYTTGDGTRVEVTERDRAAEAELPRFAVDRLLVQGSCALVAGRHDHPRGHRGFIASVRTDGDGSIRRFVLFSYERS